MQTFDCECAEFLVIDDDPAITKFLATYLRQKGHTCATLTEGFQTAEFLQEKGFVDRIVARQELRSEIARVIDYCGK